MARRVRFKACLVSEMPDGLPKTSLRAVMSKHAVCACAVGGGSRFARRCRNSLVGAEYNITHPTGIGTVLNSIVHLVWPSDVASVQHRAQQRSSRPPSPPATPPLTPHSGPDPAEPVPRAPRARSACQPA